MDARQLVERIFGVSVFLFDAAGAAGYFVAGWYYDRFVYALVALCFYLAAREVLRELKYN
jgi:hypothetical protein